MSLEVLVDFLLVDCSVELSFFFFVIIFVLLDGRYCCVKRDGADVLLLLPPVPCGSPSAESCRRSRTANLTKSSRRIHTRTGGFVIRIIASSSERLCIVPSQPGSTRMLNSPADYNVCTALTMLPIRKMLIGPEDS